MAQGLILRVFSVGSRPYVKTVDGQKTPMVKVVNDWPRPMTRRYLLITVMTNDWRRVWSVGVFPSRGNKPFVRRYGRELGPVMIKAWRETGLEPVPGLAGHVDWTAVPRRKWPPWVDGVRTTINDIEMVRWTRKKGAKP